MCWSGPASAILASCGLAGCIYAIKKGKPPELWGCLAFFSLMEILQAFTYAVIDVCSSPMNQIATLLGFLHIAIQPFFINMISMHFIPQTIKEQIRVGVYSLCLVAMVLMFLKVYPFSWAELTPSGKPLCSDRLCSVSGNWHIAWELPVNKLFNMTMFGYEIVWLPYIITAFVLPLLYGSWRFTLYHLLMGPTLAWLSTDNPNEFPAVWCLLSIGFLLLVVETPIKKWLFVKRVWWRKSEVAEAPASSLT
jgi:hypothetical protein